MEASMASIIFWVTFILFISEFLALLFKKNILAAIFRSAGLWSCVSGLMFIALAARRPPLSGPFEASLYIVFILILLGTIYQKNKIFKPEIQLFFMINSIVVMIIFALQAGRVIAINDDYYMYDNIWVLLFFNLRLLAAAFFVHAAVLHLLNLTCRIDDKGLINRYVRYSLLMGTMIYLCSEWSGSFWCLNWFGDAWRWSNGFFKASMLFLLAMLVCHLPGYFEKNKSLKAMIGLLPGVFALWMIFYH